MQPAGPTVRETAFAKINLALHVRRRREDGYHEIETIFAFAADGDELSWLPGGPPGLTLSGPFAAGLSAGGDNLVLRAAAAIGRPDASLHLDKRLPIAAGIGGGSADAAAALRLLRTADIDGGALDAIARELGADVPACLHARTARAEGIGYPVEFIEATGLTGMPLLLVNPRVPCPTGPVFRGWDGVDRGPLAHGDPLAAARAGRNDLELPARRLIPVIGEVLAMLAAQAGVRLSRMSGSGATCFALFDDASACTATVAAIRTMRPDWWCLETTLR
jgi:4-diphosphocytidyl-2-C-methyl-D-erythritol kinase